MIVRLFLDEVEIDWIFLVFQEEGSISSVLKVTLKKLVEVGLVSKDHGGL